MVLPAKAYELNQVEVDDRELQLVARMRKHFLDYYSDKITYDDLRDNIVKEVMIGPYYLMVYF